MNEKENNLTLEGKEGILKNPGICSFQYGLCRFGFELLQNVFKYYGTKILIISNEEIEKTSEQELTENLISIIHEHFSIKSSTV